MKLFGIHIITDKSLKHNRAVLDKANITPTDLELVSSDNLIEELASRHTELIVIRNHQKKRKQDNVYVKTGRGSKAREDKDYDLVEATSMLQAAHWQLIYEYLDGEEKK